MPVAFIHLARTCAPTIATEMLAAIVSLESGFSPFTIRINSGLPLAKQPSTKAEAIRDATELIAQHQDIDLGLGGVSAGNLGKLGLTVTDAFDPCLNLKATARLLDGYYRTAVRSGAAPAEAKSAMLQTYYGHGDASIGKMVNFDAQVRHEAKRLASRLKGPGPGMGEGAGRHDAIKAVAPTQPELEPPASDREAIPALWDVFNAGRKSSVLVFPNQQAEQTE